MIWSDLDSLDLRGRSRSQIWEIDSCQGGSSKHGSDYIGIRRWNDVTFSRCHDELEMRMRQIETKMETKTQILSFVRENVTKKPCEMS